MANRYWVGVYGNATWNSSATSVWSTTPGGSPGASVPSTGDDVFFDSYGWPQVYIAQVVAKSITVQVDNYNFLASLETATQSVQIYGGLTLPAATTWAVNMYNTGTLTFTGTAAKTIDTNNILMDSGGVVFSGTGSHSFSSDFNTKATVSWSGASTMNLNSHRLTCGAFLNTLTGTVSRTLNFGASGEIYVLDWTNASQTLWNTTNNTGLVTTGSRQVIIDSPGSNGSTMNVYPGAMVVNSFSFKFIGQFPLNFLNLSGHSAGNVDMSLYTGNWNATNYCFICGDLTMSPTMTMTGAALETVFFTPTSGASTIFINTNGNTFKNITTFNPGASVTVKLMSDFTILGSRTCYLTTGNLDLNGFTMTVGGSNGSGGYLGGYFQTASGTKSITFNGGSLVCWPSSAASSSFYNVTPTPSFTTYEGSVSGGKIICKDSSTFTGGNQTYNCTLHMDTTGTTLIQGNNSFKNITTDTASAYSMTAGTTQTILSKLTLSGTAGNLATVKSSIVGTPVSVNCITGAECDYLSVTDVKFLQNSVNVTDGTAAINVFLGTNSRNYSSVTGALFTNSASLGTRKVYIVANASTTSWTPPSDWNSAHNEVHLIGGGGGGSSGSSYPGPPIRSGGGGGGGGGYVKIRNHHATPGTPISIQVGYGGPGSANASSATSSYGTSGQETIFKTNNIAYGGGGGYSGGGSVGGSGGSGFLASGVDGIICVGGNGGPGGVSNSAIAEPGGGGGGAGGPNGVGGGGGFVFPYLGSLGGSGGGAASGGGNGADILTSGGGGAGGNNYSGYGGGTDSVGLNNGYNGGGGAGSYANDRAGAGGGGIDIYGTGPGGGAGGGRASASVFTYYGGNYGGGGGGGQSSATATVQYGGSNGGGGAIIITYVPQTSNFLQMFDIWNNKYKKR